MKLNSNRKRKSLGLMALALMGFAVLLGAACNSKTVPVGAYAPPSSQFNYTLVSNFEGNLNPTPEPTHGVNSHLFETGVPGNVVQEAGWWTPVNNFPTLENCIMTIQAPGANGTALSCHMSGGVTDMGDGTYPSVSIIAYLDVSNPPPYKAYHAGFFTGVKFYLNITKLDTATDRHFYIPTTQEQVPPVGTCTAGTKCYNYFGTPTGWLPNGTNGWTQFTYNFTDLAPTPYGLIPSPSTLTGVNLDQVLGLEFAEGRANSKGTANIDLWVDEVYFY